MNGKYIGAFLVVLVLVIVVVIVFDNKEDRADTSTYLTTNPFEKDIEAYQQVEDSLITHVEKKQISLKVTTPKAIGYKEGRMYLLADDFMQVFRMDGKELRKVKVDATSKSFTILENNEVLLACTDHLVLLSETLTELKRSEPMLEANYSGVASNGSTIFVSDAGKKQVLVFDMDLNIKKSFQGESGVSDQHGFIIPSAHFDLGVNEDGELWVVNPGMHALQNYSDDGKLRGSWNNSSFEIDGFSGCCNPFHIAFQKDGSFVTSEKGLVRIKIYEPYGKLRSVVAAPSSFTNGTKAPDIALDENGSVLALDFDRKMIRIFTLK